MNFQILISTMFLEDISEFIKNCNLKSNAIIVNQCDENNIQDFDHNTYQIKLINTTTRGLSKSRNIALNNATADYCLICDDDEYLEENIENIIIKNFEETNGDILAFKVHNLNKKDFNKITKINYLSALKVSSVQVAFKLNSIKKNNIKFDENIGAGVSAGGGEENLFLFQCLKKNLILYKVPEYISTLLPSVSTWKTNFNERYFLDKGKLFRKLFPFPLNFIYLNYFIFSKGKKFSKDISLNKAYTSIIKGLIS